jgi:hypothetical protein
MNGRGTIAVAEDAADGDDVTEQVLAVARVPRIVE